MCSTLNILLFEYQLINQGGITDRVGAWRRHPREENQEGKMTASSADERVNKLVKQQMCWNENDIDGMRTI